MRYCLTLPTGGACADDVRAIRAAAGDRPYDVTVGGSRSSDPDADADRLSALEAAGATWASEYVPVQDPATMRRIVDRGPIRAR